MHGQARILDRDLGAGPEHARQQPQGLGRAAAHEHRGLVGHDPPNAPQVPGDRPPQLGRPTRIGVSEGAVRGLSQDRPLRAQPGAAGKRGEVGVAGEEVVAERVCDGRGRRRRRADGAGGDEGPGAGPRRQVPLGEQLGVGVDDQPARYAEVGRQLPRGRQPGVGRQATLADRPPELLLELGPQGPRRPRSSRRSRSPPELVPIKTSRLVLYGDHRQHIVGSTSTPTRKELP